MSLVGLALRALAVGVNYAAVGWLTVGWGYPTTAPGPAPAAVAVTVDPAPTSYAPDAVAVTGGDDTVVTWPAGNLDPGDTRTSTLTAVPAVGGDSGPVTVTSEHR